MPDEIDRAQAADGDYQAQALRENQRNREPGTYSGSNCIDCGEEIPEARREAAPGCRRCLPCQEQHELLAHWR